MLLNNGRVPHYACAFASASALRRSDVVNDNAIRALTTLANIEREHAETRRKFGTFGGRTLGVLSILHTAIVLYRTEVYAEMMFVYHMRLINKALVCVLFVFLPREKMRPRANECSTSVQSIHQGMMCVLPRLHTAETRHTHKRHTTPSEMRSAPTHKHTQTHIPCDAKCIR